jgi:hypothetical protein
MARPFDPFALWALSMQLGLMTLEAQSVIAMRLWGMAGLWSVTPKENSRMVSEKAAAFTRSGTAVARALMGGQSVDRAMAAGVRPIRRTTRANSRRLARRGPKRR